MDRVLGFLLGWLGTGLILAVPAALGLLDRHRRGPVADHGRVRKEGRFSGERSHDHAQPVSGLSEDAPALGRARRERHGYARSAPAPLMTRAFVGCLQLANDMIL